MKKRYIIFIIASFLLVTLFLAYRITWGGGRIIKAGAASEKGFITEYYLFIPDTLNVSDSTFLLVEPNLLDLLMTDIKSIRKRPMRPSVLVNPR